MSFFSKEKVVLSSPMEGTITFNGEPAVGAKLVRTIKWQSDFGDKDTVLADEGGAFEFPVVEDSWRPILPTEFVVYQDIHVYYAEQEFHIWIMSKRREELWGELGGKPTNFRCELTDELVRVEVEEGLLGTSCKWNLIER